MGKNKYKYNYLTAFKRFLFTASIKNNSQIFGLKLICEQVLKWDTLRDWRSYLDFLVNNSHGFVPAHA